MTLNIYLFCFQFQWMIMKDCQEDIEKCVFDFRYKRIAFKQTKQNWKNIFNIENRKKRFKCGVPAKKEKKVDGLHPRIWL